MLNFMVKERKKTSSLGTFEGVNRQEINLLQARIRPAETTQSYRERTEGRWGREQRQRYACKRFRDILI